MAYPLPALEDMTGFLVALGRSLLPTRNLGSRFAFYRKLFRTIAGAATDVHASLRSAARDVMPTTARGAALDTWLGIVGLVRKGATGARGSSALRVRGTAGAFIAAGSTLTQVTSGMAYQLDEDVTLPGGAAPYYDASVSALTKGAASRLSKGTSLQFDDAVVGIKRTAILIADLATDGYDSEPDGSASVRLLARLAKSTAGGNQNDFTAWALAVDGIARAYVYKGRAGLGSVDVAAFHLGTGSSRHLTDSERVALASQLNALGPGQLINGALRVLKTVDDLFNVTIAVTVDGTSAYAWDFADGGGMLITSYDPATRIVGFAAPLPASLTARSRIAFSGDTTIQDGAQYVVEAISSSTSIKLAKATTVDLASGDLAFSGGPVVDVIRNAVLAHLSGERLYAGPDGPLPESETGDDTTTLNVLLEGAGPANPDGKYGPWLGGAFVSALSTIVTYTRGTRTHVIENPTSDEEAPDYTFPNDGQIGVVAPRAVLVRNLLGT